MCTREYDSEARGLNLGDCILIYQQQQLRKLGNIKVFYLDIWVPQWESSYAKGTEPEQRCSSRQRGESGSLHPGFPLGNKDHLRSLPPVIPGGNIFNKMYSYALLFLPRRLLPSLVCCSLSALSSLAALIKTSQ